MLTELCRREDEIVAELLADLFGLGVEEHHGNLGPLIARRWTRHVHSDFGVHQ